MKKYAAHFLFDGMKLIKNAIVSVDNQYRIDIEYNDFIIEKSNMSFYNGILIPKFSLKKFSYEELHNFVKILLKLQNNTNNIEKILSEFIMFLQPENLFLELNFQQKTGFLLLENLDLQNLKITQKTFFLQLF